MKPLPHASAHPLNIRAAIAASFSLIGLASAPPALLAGAIALLAGLSGQAQSYTWDPLQNTTGSDGAGTWDTNGLIWARGGVEVAWPNTASVAIIGSDQGAAGAITLSSATIITNAGITFDPPASGNYILIGGTNYLAGATPTIAVNGSNALINSLLQGTSGLTKDGAASLTNSGANTYTGPTVIKAGSLVVGAGTIANVSSPIGINSAVVISNIAGATLNLNNNNTQAGSLSGGGGIGGNVILGSGTLTLGADNTSQTYGGVISGTGGLAMLAGTGSLTLTNTNTFTGGLTIGVGGTVSLAGPKAQLGALTGTYGGVISKNCTFYYSYSTNMTNSGANTGTGLWVVNGPGTLTLSGTSSFTGNIEVDGGILSDTDARDVGTPTSSGLGNPQTAGRTVTINNGGILSLDTPGGNAFGNGNTIPKLSFIVNEGGVMRVTDGNDGVGPVVLNGGTLIAANEFFLEWEPFELGGGVTVGGTSPSLMTSTIGDQASGYNLGINSTVATCTFNVALTGAAGPDLTVAATLAGAGGETTETANLTKTGAGTMALAGSNVYTGNTTISAGKLLLTNGGNLNMLYGSYPGNIINNSIFVDASITAFSPQQVLRGVISGTGTNVVNGAGVQLTLAGTNTYTGPTIISAGTLNLTGGATIGSSSVITITNGGVFNASGLTSGIYTMGKSQNLMASNVAGAYAVIGSVVTGSSSTIYPGGSGAAGTLTFSNALTLTGGATVAFDLSTASASDGGNDDELIAKGALTIGSGDSITLNALSGAANLDQTSDYLLISALGGFTGAFNAAPLWVGTKPANHTHFIVTNDPINNEVRLTYTPNASPGITAATATPSTSLLRNETVRISVTVALGTSPTINSVTLNLGALGGSLTSPLFLSSTANVWTNTITIPPGFSPGSAILTATVTDANGLTGAAIISITVVASTETWNGGGTAGSENFGNNTNWVSGWAPGYAGDTLVFIGNGGTAGPNPNLDTNYTVNSLTFSNNAGSFIIGSSNGSVLTLAGSVVNNSTALQTLNMPITLNATETFKATSGDITVSGPIAGVASGTGLTVNGLDAVTLSGTNTYTGATIVSAGILNITGLVINPAATNSVGNTSAASNAVENISGSGVLTAASLYIGNFNGGAGAIYQTGGAVTAVGAPGVEDTCIGNIAGSYGYYDAAGGTLTTIGIVVGGEDNHNFATAGNGIMEINGGTIINPGWIVVSRANNAEVQTGILNVYSGTLTYAWNGVMGNGLSGGLICNWSSGQTSVVNIMGGIVSNTINVGINLNQSGNASNTGILNLNGGIVQAGCVTNAGTGMTQVNFNGGTLAAGASTAAFLQGLTSANVFSGGGTINNNGCAITIAQPLLSPAGSGLNTAPVIASGGAGYIAPPIVAVVRGTGDTNGVGATAIAQINRASGVVTNIIITSPGINYTATPTFALSGGGTSNQATLTGATPTPNTSGGLNFTGSGVLTLTGASTYTGTTAIGAGTLALAGSGSLAGNITVAGGATLDVSGLTVTNCAVPGQAFTASRGAAAANIKGAPGGSVSLGTLPITLTNNGTGPSLMVLQGNLALDGNQFIINGPGQLPIGTYNLVQASNGLILNTSAIASGSSFPTPVGTALPPGATATIYLTGGSLANAGTVLQLAIVAPNIDSTPTNLTFSVSGNNLTIGWPANQTGWRLLMQSNSVSAGLLTNPVNWVTVPGSASVNQEMLQIGATNEVFFKLVYP